jgi:uncharacterized protein YegL
MGRFDETPRIAALNREHMSVLIAADTSGSVSGAPLANINKNLNRFKECVCEDETASRCVDVCIISFDDEVHLVQDWTPIKDMAPVELDSGGCTDLNGAVLYAIDKIRERSNVYLDQGVIEKKPYLIVMTDGYDNVTGNVDEAARKVAERTNTGKLKLFFLGFGEYDKHAAAQLTEANGKWCFEVKDGDFNFNDFFDFIGNSVKAVSVSAAGAKVTVETPITSGQSNVKTVDLDKWLNS